MEKSKLMLLTISALTASLFLFSCKNPADSEKNAEEKNNEEQKNENDSQTLKSTDLIKFNISDAKVVATQWISSSGAKYARALEDDPIDSLLMVKEDENGEEVVSTAMEVSKELEEWCKPQPVREVYKCPYTQLEEEAEGVYTVFADNTWGWKYKDGTDAPNIGQIMYVRPDGKTFDILNFDNDVSRGVVTYVKENSGKDYILFDLDGNAYILVNEYDNDVVAVYRFNPVKGTTDRYALNVEADFQNLENEVNIWVDDFDVSADGRWIFLNAHLNLTGGRFQSNVYAIPVNSSNSEQLVIYENEIDGGWVNSLVYNDGNSTLYFYEWDSDFAMENAGLFALKRKSNFTFDVKDLKRYIKISPWEFHMGQTKYVINEDETTGKRTLKENPDYAGFLKYLKDLCCYHDGSIDDIELNLSFFNTDIAKEHGLGHLYKEDEEGNPLKEIEALKYLFETPFDDEEEHDFDAIWDSFQGAAWGWENDFQTEEEKNKGYYPYFLSALMWNKNTGKTPINDYCFFKQDFTDVTGGNLFMNDDGIWNYGDIGSNKEELGGEWTVDYARVFQVADADGKFILSQPASFAEKKLYLLDDGYERRETEPWYKKPFMANTEGFAVKSLDSKTIYYHKNGVTTDLLANDPFMTANHNIYSFSLSDTTLIYNATTPRGGNITVTVDLKSKTSVEHSFGSKIQLESMVSK